MTISPAAGPLIVSLEPEKKLTTTPPIIAVTNPISGGNSEALAIPKLNGSANKNTINPEVISLVKFSINPLVPSLGIFDLIFDMKIQFNFT
jgi:hypothetical protein